MSGWKSIAGLRVCGDSVGENYGFLTERGFRFRVRCGCQTVTHCVFQCVCGKHVICTLNNVKTGKIRSCGCQRGEFLKVACNSHRMVNTPEYRSWSSMKWRCDSRNERYSKHYSGRGIKYCERWSKFENFFQDMGPRPVGTTLDRIDVNGNYEPGNCRWATNVQQMRNTRNNVVLDIDGLSMTVVEWAEVDGASCAKTIYHRVRCGLPAREAVFGRLRRG